MYGSSQETIGKALDTLGYPVNIYSAEKVWTSSTQQGIDQIQLSAEKWGLNQFDLVQVHNLKNWRGHLETLYGMKEAGRLTHIGVTTSHGRRHGELALVLLDYPLDFVQLTYNPVDREVENRLLPVARERDIRVIVNRPFQRGSLTQYLTGKRLPALAEAVGASSWAQLILACILSHPATTIMIPATTSVSQVLENKAAEKLPVLTRSQREDLARTIRKT